VRVGIDVPYFAVKQEIRDYAQAAEEAGYHYLGFSGHVASAVDSPWPAPHFTFDEPWHEPFTLLAFLAGVTERVELSPAVVLLPLYPPVLAAKQAAEADLLSGSRVRLVASIGWNNRECAALGVVPATRGRRFEEQIVLVRRLWAERAVSHDGEFFRLNQVGISPRPGRRIPVWMGAGSIAAGGFPGARALDRIARLADGFKLLAPAALQPQRSAALLPELRRRVAGHGRDPDAFGFEARLVLRTAAPSQWRAMVQFWSDAGASHLGVSTRLAGGEVAAQIGNVRAFAEATRDLWSS
jgi:probable F420-dependent oxidoreductase